MTMEVGEALEVSMVENMRLRRRITAAEERAELLEIAANTVNGYKRSFEEAATKRHEAEARIEQLEGGIQHVLNLRVTHCEGDDVLRAVLASIPQPSEGDTVYECPVCHKVLTSNLKTAPQCRETHLHERGNKYPRMQPTEGDTDGGTG